jgi:hypothetical protein
MEYRLSKRSIDKLAEMYRRVNAPSFVGERITTDNAFLSTFRGRLTERTSTEGHYYWEEVILNYEGEWVALPNGLKHTDSDDNAGPAIEIGGVGITAVDSIVILHRQMVLQADGKYHVSWVFSPPSDSIIPIRITGATLITDQYHRWRYSWVQSQLVKNGAWEDTPDGDSSTSGTYAYNSIEANNGETGIQGNSINVGNLPAGYTIQPVRGNPIVFARPIINCDDERELIFEYVNQVDGECS